MNTSRSVARATTVCLAALGASAALMSAPQSPAYALGPGQACVFLEPEGAPVPVLGNVGHIGWGFLVAGSDQWIYGSTENPNGDYQIYAPGFNGAWSAQGNYASMLNDFVTQRHFPATAKQPGPAHPYTSYKCVKTDGSSVGAAKTAASGNLTAGYTGIGNNCLDATIRVLNAYGVPGLPSASFYPYPNNWFNALGTGWTAGRLPAA
ncbi:hypothetical protein [[Actinomadura] parvosata]|nr:hypothetical protein [Nonomuraea sp. ATCC 55076]